MGTGDTDTGTGGAQDWPDPEPPLAPLPPDEFTRATKLDPPPRRMRGATNPHNTNISPVHHTTEAWPEPEQRPSVGDFTRRSINENTLAHIGEKSTLRDSRPEWRFRDYGQWKPAPIAALAPLLAVLIAAAIILLIPLALTLDVFADTATAMWEARANPNQTIPAAAKETPAAAALALICAAAAAWHIRTAIGVGRGSRASLISARILTGSWTFLGIVILTEDLTKTLSITGGYTAIWALTALTIAAFSLTWAPSIKEWCRKTLRAAN